MAKDYYWFLPELHTSKKEFDVVYVIKFDRFYKVGITNNLKQRFTAFFTTLPLHPELIGYFKMPYMTGLRMENALLQDLISHKTRGEWCKCSEEYIFEVIYHWSREYNIEFIKPKL